MESAALQWFAMRATYKREIKAKEYLEGKGLKVFVPMKTVVRSVRGIKRKLKEPAISSLIFVKAAKDELQRIKFGVEYLQYVTRKEGGKNMPIVVPDVQMEQFMGVVQDDNIEKTFFTPQQVNLEPGTRVRVHGGVLDGQEGVLLKVEGKRKKQFFIVLPDLVTVNVGLENLDLLESIE